MITNTKFKRTLMVFFIVSIALIALFAASYVISPLALHPQSETIPMAIKNDAKMVLQLYSYLFSPKSATQLTAQYAPDVCLVLSIITYVISGLVVTLIILSCVYLSKKKKAFYIFYVIAVLGALLTACILIALSGYKYLNIAAAYRKLGIFLGLLTFAIGVIEFFAVFITVALGLIYVHQKSVEQPAVEENIPTSVAEAAGDPEAIQEGEELSPVDGDVLIASEPDPVAEDIDSDEPVPEEEIPQEEPHVDQEPKEEKQQHVEVNVNNTPNGGYDNASLASLLREVVRDIVRDEIARNNLNQPQQPQQAPNGNQTITGATFGGPLVVQYFNGGINGVNPATPVVAAPAPAPAPIAQEAKQEKKVEKIEEVKPAPQEAKEEKPAPKPLFVKKEEAEEKPAEPVVTASENNQKEEKVYERLTFGERLLKSDEDIHALYNELKNEILSYGVKSRISSVGDTFRLHKKMYVRITVAGKSLKLYFALNPADYTNSTLPIQDASEKDMYKEIPLVFKVKSPLSVRRCKELIQDVMEKDGLEQGEIGKVNWIKELKAELIAQSK